MSDQDAEKRQAGIAAAEQVRSGMTLGLGSGSTVYFYLEELGRRVREDGLQVAGIPTSERTAALARDFGVPLTTFDEHQTLDLAVDGADEVDPKLNLVKGHGGALLREKIIAAAAKRLVIIVDSTKLSDALGTRMTLPVEVVPFACALAQKRLADLGAQPVLRATEGQPFVTDNGNWILDCAFAPMADPARLEADINRVPGVMENGLFIGMADEVIVARSGSIERINRPV
ncbi:MAG TPA: ribose-5-phosphate isomerase RpiA [Chloroflexota bacterium]|nr:ribose-5-phosphate isomerase RpiA [Chloroflexota bacterium]